MPFISRSSPSFFQNLIRAIPGTQDILRHLQSYPDLEPRRLMGQWHWVSPIALPSPPGWKEGTLTRSSSRPQSTPATAPRLKVGLSPNARRRIDPPWLAVKALTELNSTFASFGTVDQFREGGPGGPPKLSFGYGLRDARKTSLYSQADPCPCTSRTHGPSGLSLRTLQTRWW